MYTPNPSQHPRQLIPLPMEVIRKKKIKLSQNTTVEETEPHNHVDGACREEVSNQEEKEEIL